MIRLPPFTRAGEAHLRDVGVLDEPGHVLVLAGDDVEHAGRQLLGDALDDSRRRERRRGRRLDDRGVAGQQRMRQRGAQDRDRPVERHDHRDDAERLVGHLGGHRDRAGDRRAASCPVSTSSASISARFQRISKTSASTHASKRTLPFSCERIAASSSRSSAMPAMASAIFAARSCALSAAHAGKAAFAAATASSTSSFEADAACPTITPGLAGIGDGECLGGVALLTADEQPRPDRSIGDCVRQRRPHLSVYRFDARRAFAVRSRVASLKRASPRTREARLHDKIHTNLVVNMGRPDSLYGSEREGTGT